METSKHAESKSEGADARRRRWSEEEREVIVRASLKKGVRVNAVAGVYGVQPWQIYDWRKKARQAGKKNKAAALLPVEVTEPDQPSCSLVIEAQGLRITMTGLLDAIVVRSVLECLGR